MGWLMFISAWGSEGVMVPGAGRPALPSEGLRWWWGAVVEGVAEDVPPGAPIEAKLPWLAVRRWLWCRSGFVHTNSALEVQQHSTFHLAFVHMYRYMCNRSMRNTKPTLDNQLSSFELSNVQVGSCSREPTCPVQFSAPT